MHPNGWITGGTQGLECFGNSGRGDESSVTSPREGLRKKSKLVARNVVSSLETNLGQLFDGSEHLGRGVQVVESIKEASNGRVPREHL